MNSPPKNMR